MKYYTFPTVTSINGDSVCSASHQPNVKISHRIYQLPKTFAKRRHKLSSDKLQQFGKVVKKTKIVLKVGMQWICGGDIRHYIGYFSEDGYHPRYT